MNLRCLSQKQNASRNNTSARIQTLHTLSLNQNTLTSFLDNIGENLDFDEGEQNEDMWVEEQHVKINADKLRASEETAPGPSWIDQ